MNAARASASAIDTLLNRVASIQAVEAVTDSLQLAGRVLETAADTSASIIEVRAEAGESRLIHSRQIIALRENAAHRAAEYAAAKTHIRALLAAVDSLPRKSPDAGAFVRGIATWPLAFIVLVLLIFHYPERVQTILERVRAIRFLGSEVVLDEQTTSAAQETFESLRKQAKQRYQYAAHKMGLDQRFVDLMNTGVRPLLKSDTQSLRATLYIPDILFAKHLAQAVDYWPGGTGRGRAFPVYFGMIGKAWRLGKSRIEGHVTTTDDNLIEEWGMTREEARAKGKDRQSFAAIVLARGTHTVGILYMDCKTESAFGESDQENREFAASVLQACSNADLVATLVRVRDELAAESSPIDLQLEP